jgi:pyrimidine operon attenuation protein / uracil phosphoribosyltransferase
MQPKNLIDAQLLYDTHRVDAMVQSMAEAIALQHPEGSELAIIGIQQKGVLVAQTIKVHLQKRWPSLDISSGDLDVGMYRDDLSVNPAPTLQPTSIPDNLEGKDVILVDDVLQSGRTIRAAMDALLDFGRPRRIQLAVLFDRGQRKLPIQPDYVGELLEIEDDQFIVVKTLEEKAGVGVYLTFK